MALIYFPIPPVMIKRIKEKMRIDIMAILSKNDQGIVKTHKSLNDNEYSNSNIQ